jgi:hypothetical protein
MATVCNTTDTRRDPADNLLPDVRDILVQGPPRRHLCIGTDNSIPPPAGATAGFDHGRIRSFRQDPGYRDAKRFEEALGVELVEEPSNALSGSP